MKYKKGQSVFKNYIGDEPFRWGEILECTKMRNGREVYKVLWLDNYEVCLESADNIGLIRT